MRRVGARGHDRRIGIARRAVLLEHELERRLHLVLVLPGPGIAHRLDVGVAADLAGAALARQLLGERLSRSSCRIGPGSSTRTGVDEAARARRASPATRRIIRAGRGAGCPADTSAVRSIAYSAQLGVELVDGVGGVGAIGRDGALDPRPPAVPHLHLAVARPDEEHEALLRVSGVDDRHRVGLVESGEEVEVGVLAKLEAGIGIARSLARRRMTARASPIASANRRRRSAKGARSKAMAYLSLRRRAPRRGLSLSRRLRAPPSTRRACAPRTTTTSALRGGLRMDPAAMIRLLGLRWRLAQGEEHARRERPRPPDPRPAVDHHPLAPVSRLLEGRGERSPGTPRDRRGHRSRRRGTPRPGTGRPAPGARRHRRQTCQRISCGSARQMT